MINNLDISMREYIETLNKNIEEITRNYRNLDFLNGNKKLISLIDYILKLVDYINKCGNIELPINDSLNEMMTALENEDYMLISDLLEYELSVIFNDFLKKWEIQIDN